MGCICGRRTDRHVIGRGVTTCPAGTDGFGLIRTGRAGLYESLDILRDDVDLEVDPVPDQALPDGRRLESVWNESDPEHLAVAHTFRTDVDHGETDPVDGDRSLVHNITRERVRKLD